MRTRFLATALLGASVLLASAPAIAQADSSSTLTVVGTSDVFDSNLVQSVLKPGFEKAYPQYTLNYVSKGTGAAIQYAEAGTASALLVHAASLENQFVAQGYSAEPYGQALFYGDYVLLGPASDPAGVLANAPHDIVGAFERIAAAGASGKANFVSRGGTPGTTVEEHAIWQLSTGTTLCTVSSANGGGESPSTAGGACPDTISYPSWYHATGQTQAPNIETGDVCNFPGGGCYVLTDRGTYDYLQSTNAIHSLQIVTRDNAASSTGGSTLLVNSFHGYVINPAKFSAGVAAGINVPAATAFLNWVTSPAGQKAVGSYLNGSKDAPFLPDASPVVTTAKLPASLAGGGRIKLTGKITNPVPGAPPLAGKKVTLSMTPTYVAAHHLRVTTAVQTVLTNVNGAFTFRYQPKANATYTVSTSQISQIENAMLSPTFGDLLTAGSGTAGRTDVVGGITVTSTSVTGRVATFKVHLSLPPNGTPAHLKIYEGSVNHGLKLIKTATLTKGRTLLTVNVQLPVGTTKVRLEDTSLGQFDEGRSAVTTVTVP
jgi:tungstate transport system substrate-binding protein